MKRSVALPQPVNEWLIDKASREGLSVSALISHLLMNAAKGDSVSRNGGEP